MVAATEGAITERDIHEMQLWAVWFEMQVREATHDGVDTGICEALLRHARHIVGKAQEVQAAWGRGGEGGRSLRGALRTALQHFGGEGLEEDYEQLQLEMLKLVVTILQQEMLRLYYVMQNDRESMSLARAPGRDRGDECFGLPLLPDDMLWYLVPHRPTWSPAAVRCVRSDGAAMLDAERGRWLAPWRQVALVRPRASFELTPPCVTPWELANAQRCGSGGSSSSSRKGLAKVTVQRPLTDDGPYLGLQLREQGLTVASLKDPSAGACGWSVGDHVVAVGGAPVSTRRELEAALEKARNEGWSRDGLRGLDFVVCRDTCAQSRATSAASGSGLLLTYSASSGSSAADCAPAAAEGSLGCREKLGEAAEAQHVSNSPALARAATDPLWAKAREAISRPPSAAAVPAAAPRFGPAADLGRRRELDAAVGGWPRWG
mmetsp:Transcript_15150/g.43267  ORF Transcript_15150/g.43267 Transcript_15150/m.43267 type:complete len:434 (-) Transcript_15150:22-1323(-)